LCDIHTLYRCHDRLLEHKRAVFDHLADRWRDLFNVSFGVLLYDEHLISSAIRHRRDDAKCRFGHSRDRRSDCVQVVIALVTSEVAAGL
jgi:transposase